MYENVATFVSGATVIFGVLLIFLYIKLFSTWKKTEPNLIKTCLFLTDKYVMRNIYVVFITGILIVLHNFIEFLVLAYPDFYFKYISSHYPSRLFAVTELLIALLLIEWLLYQWLKTANDEFTRK